MLSEKSEIKTLSHIKESLKAKAYDYLLAALGFVAGLAWNDAIKTLIDYFFPLSKDSLFAKFIYAVFITFVVVIFGNYLIKKEETEQKEKNE
jgi:hypothetical protein